MPETGGCEVPRDGMRKAKSAYSTNLRNIKIDSIFLASVSLSLCALEPITDRNGEDVRVPWNSELRALWVIGLNITKKGGESNENMRIYTGFRLKRFKETYSRQARAM
jgi:hypothetical protein